MVGFISAKSLAQLYTPELKVKDTGGNVGIGTDNPGNYTLNVNGSFLTKELETVSGNLSLNTAKYLDRWQDCTGDAVTLEANPNFGSSVFRIRSGHAETDKIGLFNITQQNQSVMYVRMDGNVGIGTSSPQATLDVRRGNAPYGTAVFSGTNRASHFNYSTSEHTYIRGGKSTSNVFINDDGGLVGIGTTSPIAKLHVSGDMYMNTDNDAVMTFNNNDNSWQYFQFKRSDSRKAWMGLNNGNDFCIYKEGGGNIILNGPVKVSSIDKWPDFVFAETYDLPTLSSLEKYVTKHNHLPEIPSEAEVKKNGINLVEMDAKLLQKIEELTLYLIEQNKKIEQLEKKVRQLEATH